MTQFVATGSVLDRILAHKVGEIDALRPRAADIRHAAELAPAPPPFAASLHKPTVALIAEVKRASPSKGLLIEDFDAVRIAREYEGNGASAVSVLADTEFFMGSPDFVRDVAVSVSLPVLFKEFVIDPLQVDLACSLGASAVLLIVAALEDIQLRDLSAHIAALGMDALVEVHDEHELERALRIGVGVVGVNNRDLKTFREDLSITERLATRLDGGVTLVAESAIRSPDDVARMARAGAHAVLVGEGLIKAADRPASVRQYASIERPEVAS